MTPPRLRGLGFKVQGFRVKGLRVRVQGEPEPREAPKKPRSRLSPKPIKPQAASRLSSEAAWAEQIFDRSRKGNKNWVAVKELKLSYYIIPL